MKIFITGGSGFVGTHLGLACLEAGHEVTALGTRAHYSGIAHPRFRYVAGDATREGAWQDQIADADLIYNLAGCSIFQRWTRQYKQQIEESRILTTRNVVAAMPGRDKVTLVSASAVGYYGDHGDTLLNEDAPAGKDFLATLASQWEQEAIKAECKSARVVLARFGVVLGAGGGALAKMVPAFRSFVGGPLGSGRQWFPWIHIADVLKALQFLAHRDDLKGPFNLTAPHPVTNAQMADALGRVMGRPAKVALPAVMLKMMMGEMSSILLNSLRVMPSALLSAGYAFEFDRIDAALADLLKRGSIG